MITPLVLGPQGHQPSVTGIDMRSRLRYEDDGARRDLVNLRIGLESDLDVQSFIR